ncbi:MAG: hypothetical protein V4496_07605 [Pseudomonadota bacterium]
MTVISPILPFVASGHVTVLRLFDVAFAIDLMKAESLWASQSRQGTRSKLTRTPKKAVDFGEAPLSLTLPAVRLTLHEPQGAVEIKTNVTARLYAFGVVTLALQIPADNLVWDAYTSRVNAVEDAIGAKTDATIWEDLLENLCEQVNGAFTRYNRSGLVEDYLLATVHRFSETIPAVALGRDIDLVPLLSGETSPLSEGAKADLLSRRFSYFTDDLVVLTWDRVFIYEPHNATDVAEVLEVANAQFLQMRYYDELLDAELPKMYDLVEAATRRRSLGGPRRFATLARRLYTLVAEVTELTEKVDNALQVTEDVYLARVYTAALDLFRVKAVTNAVDRKLAIIRDTYSALYDEAASSRAGLMEAAVIFLIFLEVMLALFHYIL